jgi:hypothetical protein
LSRTTVAPEVERFLDVAGEPLAVGTRPGRLPFEPFVTALPFAARNALLPILRKRQEPLCFGECAGDDRRIDAVVAHVEEAGVADCRANLAHHRGARGGVARKAAGEIDDRKSFGGFRRGVDHGAATVAGRRPFV